MHLVSGAVLRGFEEGAHRVRLIPAGLIMLQPFLLGRRSDDAVGCDPRHARSRPRSSIADRVIEVEYAEQQVRSAEVFRLAPEPS